MTEKTLRNIFFIGSALFFLALYALTANSISQVKGGRTPPLTADVIAGKQIWQKQDCNDCHTILGIGGYYAPDLTKVINTRGAAWLSAWLTDPAAVNPVAEMPNQHLVTNQVNELVAFLTWVGGINTNNWPPKPINSAAGGVTQAGTTAGAPDGAQLFQQKGCSGCHLINGNGTPGPGPDLSRIGSQKYDSLDNSAAFLDVWLKDPSAQKPGTLMPALPLTDAERAALVQYLTGLK